MGYREVTEALEAGAAGRDLSVVAVPDLRGAKVCGHQVEVYLVQSAVGFSVECWRKEGSSPYKIVSVEGLNDAVALALTEV